MAKFAQHISTSFPVLIQCLQHIGRCGQTSNWLSFFT